MAKNPIRVINLTGNSLKLKIPSSASLNSLARLYLLPPWFRVALWYLIKHCLKPTQLLKPRRYLCLSGNLLTSSRTLLLKKEKSPVSSGMYMLLS
jgi:hypothetical protein